MIWLAKTIQIGKRIIPAGTILNDEYETGICYYKGTKVDFSKLPDGAIFVPGVRHEMLPELPVDDENDGLIPERKQARLAVRSIFDAGDLTSNVYDTTKVTASNLTKPARLIRPSLEAKHVGDIVDVIDYDYDMPGHSVIVKHGRLAEFGTWASLRDKIRSENKKAYEELAKYCKTGHETVWKVDKSWFCHQDNKYGLESEDLHIISSDTPNTESIIFNGVPVATIVSQDLNKQSYPDTGYVNDEKHKITVLDTNDNPIELKCLDEDVVMAQTILDELAPILTATESISIVATNAFFDECFAGYDKSIDDIDKMKIMAVWDELNRTFTNLATSIDKDAIQISFLSDDDITNKGSNNIYIWPSTKLYAFNVANGMTIYIRKMLDKILTGYTVTKMSA